MLKLQLYQIQFNKSKWFTKKQGALARVNPWPLETMIFL